MKKVFFKFLAVMLIIAITVAGIPMMDSQVRVQAATDPSILTGAKIKSMIDGNNPFDVLTLPNGVKVKNNFAVPATEGKDEKSSIVTSKATTNTSKIEYTAAVKKVDITKWQLAGGTLSIPKKETIRSGEILVDETKDVSFKVNDVGENGTLAVSQPSMSEMFSDFEIHGEKTPLTNSNMIDFQPAISDCRKGIHNQASDTVTITKANEKTDWGKATQCGPSNAVRKNNLRSKNEVSAEEKAIRDRIDEENIHTFESTPLTAYTRSGGSITVTMSGELGAALEFDYDYSAFSGYKLGVSGTELINLSVKLDANLHEEVYIPLFGGNLDIGIGNVCAGIFLVVDVCGNITVVLTGGQGLGIDAGISGGTCFGVPTSFHPYATPKYYAKGECDPNGEISATVALTPKVGLEVLGIDVFSAELRLGLELYAKGNANKLDYGLSAIARMYVSILGKQKDIFNQSFKLFSREKEYFGGYYFYGNLCAYRDKLVATVLQAEEAGKKTQAVAPFTDKLFYSGDVEIGVYAPGKYESPIKTIKRFIKPEDNGRVVLELNSSDLKIDIQKGYSVRISIPNKKDALSNNIFATMPFKGMRVEYADYFNEAALGEVQPVNAAIDQPGLAADYYKSNDSKELIYCKDRKVQLNFTDSSKAKKTGSVELVTDEKGRFRLDQIDNSGNPKSGYFDIRPGMTCLATAIIDGFPFKTTEVTAESGLELIKVTDCRSDILMTGLVYDQDTQRYTTKILSFNNLEDYEKYAKENNTYKFSAETFTSADHILALNTYGCPNAFGDNKTYNSRKIRGLLNVKTEAYHTRRIAHYFAEYHDEINLYKASQLGGTANLDLRYSIVNGIHDLAYSQTCTVPINETLNNELTWYCNGIYTDITKALTSKASCVSSAHLYRRFCIKKYAPTENSRLGRNKINKTDLTINTELYKDDEYLPSQTGKNVLLKPKPEIKITQFDDLLQYSQPGGIDSTLTFFPTKKYDNPQSDFNNDLYINTDATMNFEGIKLVARQFDEWKFSTTVGKKENKQTADQKIGKILSDPLAYYYSFITIPAYSYDNLRENEWKPAAGSMNHKISINSKTGSATVDGIAVTLDNAYSIQNGKLCVNTSSLGKVMQRATASTNRSANRKVSDTKTIEIELDCKVKLDNKTGVMTITYKN